MTENSEPEELISHLVTKTFARTGAMVHNYVKMLATGICQNFGNVIPRFQLFTRDTVFHLDRIEGIRVRREVDIDLSKHQVVTINASDTITHLPHIKKISINTIECMLLLVLDGLLQVADRLRTCNLDRKTLRGSSPRPNN